MLQWANTPAQASDCKNQRYVPTSPVCLVFVYANKRYRPQGETGLFDLPRKTCSKNKSPFLSTPGPIGNRLARGRAPPHLVHFHGHQIGMRGNTSTHITLSLPGHLWFAFR